MQTKEWKTKKEILKIYPISSSTYKKRIKNIDSSKTKFTSSKTGSPTRLIHHSILDELFRKRRRLSSKEYKQTIKWVRNHHWNYFGDVVPGSSNVEDIINNMRYFYNKLKELQMEKNQLTLFYAIEKNTEDKYYHAHFLIDCARDMLVAEDIEDKLELICDPNTNKEKRIYIKEYDLRYEKGGAIYNSKEKRYFYEVLG
jgi:NAD(P)H-dependent flavin oxidoreductase YrpB (nitropropane dioxygenase family)